MDNQILEFGQFHCPSRCFRHGAKILRSFGMHNEAALPGNYPLSRYRGMGYPGTGVAYIPTRIRYHYTPSHPGSPGTVKARHLMVKVECLTVKIAHLALKARRVTVKTAHLTVKIIFSWIRMPGYWLQTLALSHLRFNAASYITCSSFVRLLYSATSNSFWKTGFRKKQGAFLIWTYTLRHITNDPDPSPNPTPSLQRKRVPEKKPSPS